MNGAVEADADCVTLSLPADWLRRPGRRVILVAAGVAVGFVVLCLPFALTGSLDVRGGIAIGTLIIAVVGGLAALSTWAGREGAVALERRVWTLFALGTTSWALGGVPYALFLAGGGDPFNPAPWSQLGFLLAYPFWYVGFWMLRQPPLGESRAQRAEAWAIEMATLLVIGVVVVEVLWFPMLPTERNMALLLPVALDILLLAGLYNAARRSSITRNSALGWLAGGFGALAVTDGFVTFLVPRGFLIATGFAAIGYAFAMVMLALGAERPIRLTEAQNALGRSATVTAAVGLAITTGAVGVVPTAARPVLWVIAAFLLWRLLARIGLHQQSDVDPLTGLLGPQAFARHVAGVVQAARVEQPAVLVAIDLKGFGAWNAREGFPAGDALLSDVAARLEGADLPSGLWARMRADVFVWVGVPGTPDIGRHLAEAARGAAARNEAGLGARAGLVLVPADATSAADALAAADETLVAARAAGRSLVTFDRGRLDGVELGSGYSASLAQRRQAVVEILGEPGSIVTALQPIVDLAGGETVGFEALSRFQVEPNRPPDRWIAEAHAVGLGLEIELACVRRAVARRRERLDDAWVSLNLSAEAVLSAGVEEAIGPGDLGWLVLEITEHEQVADYTRLAARLGELRRRGVRVAVDDAGAGHSSLRHVARLGPDFIKVDVSLVRDVHLDPAKAALMRSMVLLERELGVRLVAEGVETPEELRALAGMGVTLAQGYLFGRPQPTFRRGHVPMRASPAEVAGAAQGVPARARSAARR